MAFKSYLDDGYKMGDLDPAFSYRYPFSRWIGRCVSDMEAN